MAQEQSESWAEKERRFRARRWQALWLVGDRSTVNAAISALPSVVHFSKEDVDFDLDCNSVSTTDSLLSPWPVLSVLHSAQTNKCRWSKTRWWQLTIKIVVGSWQTRSRNYLSRMAWILKSSLMVRLSMDLDLKMPLSKCWSCWTSTRILIAVT